MAHADMRHSFSCYGACRHAGDNSQQMPTLLYTNCGSRKVVAATLFPAKKFGFAEAQSSKNPICSQSLCCWRAKKQYQMLPTEKASELEAVLPVSLHHFSLSK